MKPSAPKVKESGKDEVKPKTRADLKLREKHTLDSIRYNQAHAQDHADALQAARKQLRETRSALIKLPTIR